MSLNRKHLRNLCRAVAESTCDCEDQLWGDMHGCKWFRATRSLEMYVSARPREIIELLDQLEEIQNRGVDERG